MAPSPPLRAPALWARWPEASTPAEDAGAAVIALVRTGPATDWVLLVERAIRAGDPGSGQIGLPGGHCSPEDDSPESTALREMKEEVGLTRSDLDGRPRYVGRRSAPAFGLRVAAFLAPVRVGATPTVNSPEELRGLFWLPTEALTTVHRVLVPTVTGPRRVPAAIYEDRVVWGFTWRLLRGIFGWKEEEETPGEGDLGAP